MLRSASLVLSVALISKCKLVKCRDNVSQRNSKTTRDFPDDMVAREGSEKLVKTVYFKFTVEN